MIASGTKAQVDLPVIRIEASTSAALRLSEMWEYRELLYFLVWRNIKIRYKQTAIGAAWAIIQPLMTMIIFTLVFGKFANVHPTDCRTRYLAMRPCYPGPISQPLSI
jgi:lipopolysaccharide transport system permease protein